MNDGLGDKVRDRIKEVLQRFPNVERVILFGSRATGRFRPASDIDLALEGPQLGLSDLMGIMAQIEELNFPVEVQLVIREQIQNPALQEEILRHGIQWFDRQPPATSHTPRSQS